MPPRGPVPRELDEAKGAAGQVFHLHVLFVVGQGIASDARGRHLGVSKDASEGSRERDKKRDHRRTRASAKCEKLRRRRRRRSDVICLFPLPAPHLEKTLFLFSLIFPR